MPRDVQPLRSEGELFKKIMGPQWLNLHPDIQRRFDKNPAHGKPLRYEGTLEELSCSLWGKILAHMTMPLVKGALLPYRAANFPVDIQVYSRAGCPYLFKHRLYKLPGRKPVEFTSYMKESEKGEVLEYVGAGLGMKLLVFEKEGNLHFRSDGYFWDIGLCRIPLPHILTPGDTYLVHINEGGDRFRIRIDITHRLFGKMYVQAGVFQEARPG
jgi:hypothetical protein